MSNKRPVALDHTHEKATETYDGFMSKFDKIKLNASYTGDEIDALLAGKSDTTHNHTGVYVPLSDGSISGSAVISGLENRELLISGPQSGATGFPTVYGQTYLFTGDTYGRDFALYKASSAGLYLGTINSGRTGFDAWNEIITTGNVASSHTHDDRYYTETETDFNFTKRVDMVVTDFNAINPSTLTQGRMFTFNTGFQPLNRPTSENYFSGILYVHNIAGNNSTLMCYSTGFGVYLRYWNGTSWGGWVRQWNDTTDGSGSGMDADLLDGQHGSYFQQALVSGTNIKTINGSSVLGSGDLAVTAVTDWTQVFDDSGTYRGYKAKSGSASGYMRTPSEGLLPYASSASGSGYVGTPSWPFLNIYGINIYQDGDKVLAQAARGGSTIGGGYYIKLSDGTIIQFARITFSSASNTAMSGGGGYKSANQTWTFPIAFTSADSYSVSVTPEGIYQIGASVQARSATVLTYCTHTVSSDATSRSRTVHILAIGR